eukprot:gnl/MRDRNA2_/MRDRNA2_135654_c0_seq1.p1 gnl/MRDRNA2_/MRDRNA2_135654_c0~~gnl/MRDRNA2_/MRDRNA2_135654_c0_seq1.p1  ORF type:complete len:595 (+),score=108.54 gnl/MRDRNA2_/MRDRNA2_135654_c0_seq1:103-1887(+)
MGQATDDAILRKQILTELTGPGGPFECGPVTVRGVTYPVAHKVGPRTMQEWLSQAFTPEHDAKKCFVFENEFLTYSEVKQHYEAIACTLAEQYGIKVRDRVAISMRNYPEWAVSFLAGLRMGAIMVPMNSLWKAGEMEYGFTDSGARVLICDHQRLEIALPTLKKLNVPAIVARSTTEELTKAQASAPGLVTSYKEALALGMGKPCPSAPLLDTDEDFNIMYTSGSTGNPKGVAMTHRNMLTQMQNDSLTREATNRFMTAKGVTPPSSEACMICPVPLFHVTALTHILLMTLNKGGKCVLMAKWDAGFALELIERERPTGWTSVPTMVADLYNHPDFHKRDTSSLAAIGGGGAPTPTGQVQKTKDKFKAQPLQGWGLTEVSGGCCLNAGDDYIRKPWSTGPPGHTTELRTIDPETLHDLAGAKGEIVIKGPLCMRGYWNKEEATKAAIVEVPGFGPGWFRTGDLGTIDEEGFLSITGRAKELIIRGGENISCVEVEEAFFKTGLVLEATAFSIPDERLGELVGLAVMVQKDVSVSAAELRQKVQDSKGLADFKTPLAQHISIQTEPLLRGATGKIQRREIREEFLKTWTPQSKL